VCSEKWAIWTLLLSPQDFDLKGLTIVTEPLSMQQMIDRLQHSEVEIPEAPYGPGHFKHNPECDRCAASAVLARLRELSGECVEYAERSAKEEADWLAGRGPGSGDSMLIDQGYRNALRDVVRTLDAILGEKK
jgi:hypothetical protein